MRWNFQEPEEPPAPARPRADANFLALEGVPPINF